MCFRISSSSVTTCHSSSIAARSRSRPPRLKQAVLRLLHRCTADLFHAWPPPVLRNSMCSARPVTSALWLCVGLSLWVNVCPGIVDSHIAKLSDTHVRDQTKSCAVSMREMWPCMAAMRLHAILSMTIHMSPMPDDTMQALHSEVRGLQKQKSAAAASVTALQAQLQGAKADAARQVQVCSLPHSAL